MPADKAPAAHRDPPIKPHSTEVIRKWPVGTFIENLVVLPDASLVLSIHSSQTLEHIDASGASRTLAKMPESATGLVASGSGHLYAVGGAVGKTPGYVWRVGLDCSIQEWLKIPDAFFLNGFTPLGAGKALTVDSLLGTIFAVDLTDRSYRPWLQHELLTKCSDEPVLPGVNGVKVYQDRVFVTNTDRALILAVPIKADGSAGDITVVADALRGDDMCFDAAGNLYITTHIQNSLIRLAPNGERIAIAGPEQGMPGSTSCAFGRSANDSDQLYVTTTGGVIMPYEGVTQEAKLVRIAVGARGYELPLV